MRRNVLLCALTSSVLFPLALPNEIFPLGNALVGIVALIPLYIAFLRARSPREATLAGVVFGGVSTFIANYWLMFFGDYSVWTIGGTTLGYILFNAILGPFLWRALRARAGYRPLLFAMVWTGYELLKSVGFLAYPWGLAAYPFNTLTVMIQIADVTGVWGMTFIAVYLNAALAELLNSLAGSGLRVSGSRTRAAVPALRSVAAVCILVAITAGYGAWSLQRDIPTQGDIGVLLVQQNADSWNTRDIAGPLLTAQQLTNQGLADMEHQPDVIAWSETALRYPYGEFQRWYRANPTDKPFTEFLSALPAPLLTGSPQRGADDEFTIHNAALLITPGGSIEGWYGKQQLVPFAEYVPFWQSAIVQRFFREIVGIAAIWAPGPGMKLFTVDRDGDTPVMVGTPICFEDAFAWITRRFVHAGADVFINLTNNAWSLTDSAQYQHLVAARFRAVETRRSLIRSTNAGFTGIVDPWGRVTAELPMFVEGYLAADVPVYRPDNESIYVRWGEYLPVIMIAGLLVLLMVSAIRPHDPRAAGLPEA